MKKIILIILFITSISFFLNAQKGIFFYGSGYSGLSEFGRTQVVKTQVDYLYQGQIFKLNKFSRYDYYSLFTKSFVFRLNIFKINPENSLSFCLYPNISLSIYQNKIFDEYFLNLPKGFGKIDFPAYFGYNWGLGSTYLSAKKVGLFIGGGYELSKYPLKKVSKESWTGFENQKDMFIIFGLRYWSFYTILNEINIKMSFGGKTSIPVDYETRYFGLNYNENMMISKAFSFRLTWVRYLKY